MRQLFSVGEEVILCSKSLPELNGEYIVHEVFKTGDEMCCRLTGLIGNVPKGSSDYGYTLNIAILDGFREAVWDESALRKKHKPSTESFSEMMRNLNTIKV